MFKVVASVNAYNVVNDKVQFLVNFACIITEITATVFPSKINYWVTSKASARLTVPLPSFVALPAICPQDIAVSVPDVTFMSVDLLKGNLVIQTDRMELIGSYNTSITAAYTAQGVIKKVPFVLVIDCQVLSVKMDSNSLI
jgi:hypothetical protein